ncbi:MAG: hypothetical protein U0641_00690 [Anaerolineae bacterium]
MSEIPVGVREYLSSEDPIYRHALFERYPNLQGTLDDPTTRADIVGWLSSDEAHQESNAGFVVNTLKFLRAGATPSEAPAVQPFLLSGSPYVRLRAYEYLLTLYFPDKNHDALVMLLYGMLSDSSDTIRAQAVHYIERAHVAGEMRAFLDRWYKTAAAAGWADTESYELVGQLLKG